MIIIIHIGNYNSFRKVLMEATSMCYWVTVVVKEVI